MKKKLPFILVLSVLLCVSLVFMGVASSAGTVSAQLLNAATAGEEEVRKLGVAPAKEMGQQLMTRSVSPDVDLLTAASLTEPEKTDFSTYYTESLASKYEDLSQTVWDDFDPSSFGLSVDSGIMKSHIISVENTSETEKKLRFSYVSWLTTIFEHEGQYMVWIMFNRDTQTNTLVKTDGQWKTVSIESVDKEFEPENYNPNQGTFDTLEAALDFVQSTNVYLLDPY